MKMKDSCYTFTTKDIEEKDVQKEFGNLLQTRHKIFAFIGREEEAHIIPLEQLGEHEVAFFENNIETGVFNYETFEPGDKPFSLEDVLANFVIDTEKQTVTAKKLYRFQGRYYMRTRKYEMKNYGKTWRAWDGIPKEHYVW